jgi:UDP-N-acetylmuramate dehydrogenase
VSRIQTDVSLKLYNTFGLPAVASRYCHVRTLDELTSVLKVDKPPFFILGGGSNILFTKNPGDLVLHIDIRGKEIVQEDDEHVWVRIGAGENWHRFVLWCLDKDFGGLENLSLIPGTVGASPIQNIGAYGVELKDVFDNLEAIEVLSPSENRVLSTEECEFGYRSSIFKTSEKGKYIITHVVFKLTKPTFHKVKIGYGDIQKELESLGVLSPTIQDVSNAVIKIRSSKLPNPSELGNSGSFFKNPEISSELYEKLKVEFEDMPGYKMSDFITKIPAGWLIEQCGWKGKRIGQTGSHAKQALVLVNYGNAVGSEIEALSKEIIKSVFLRFGIKLEPEVNIV